MSKLAKALTAAAGNAGESLYVEDVFSTYLYEGNSSTQTITNNIDLDGEGGLVWLKSRGPTGYNHYLYDTNRGATSVLFSNLTNGAGTQSNGLTAFNNNGFTQGSFIGSNGTGETYASWTFRKAEKFFDVVTYTGDGASSRYINHNLGANAGAIFIKRTDSASDWTVQHRYNKNYNLYLNSTSSQSDSGATNRFNDTEFTVIGSGLADSNKLTNISGATYVAYLFASDAGGFGDDGSESIIKCGSFTASGGLEVDLGFEPQWVLFKRTDSSVGGSWHLYDTMRGFGADGVDHALLYADLANAESLASRRLILTATGFTVSTNLYAGSPYIYIAIRRPMKTPESGTEVFAPNTIASSVTDGTQINSGFAIDMNMIALRGGAGVNFVTHDRLRGVSTTTSNGGLYLETTSTQAENTGFSRYFNNTGFQLPSTLAGSDLISYSFKRATGFFDVVAYTGDGNYHDWNHNLGVLPEMMIVKRRSSAASWYVWHEGQGADNSYQYLQTTSGIVGYKYSFFNSGANTTTTIRTGNSLNGLGDSYVCYLFATLAGVSKVGSYTGNGTSQTIDCGFSTGARFVLIKGTTLSSNWVVFDSERGITVNNDPVLYLNSTIAEFTDSGIDIEPDSSGFIVNSGGNVNASGETYIFLAIA